MWCFNSIILRPPHSFCRLQYKVVSDVFFNTGQMKLQSGAWEQGCCCSLIKSLRKVIQRSRALCIPRKLFLPTRWCFSRLILRPPHMTFFTRYKTKLQSGAWARGKCFRCMLFHLFFGHSTPRSRAPDK